MGRRSTLRLVFAVWALIALLPMLAMLQRSLMPDGRITLSTYTQLFASAREWTLLGNTLLLAGATAILAGLLGLPLSVLLARTNLPGRRALFALFVLPILLPPSVLAYGWVALLGRDGPLGGLLGSSGGTFLFGPAGCLIVFVASFLPVVLLFTAASLLAANPRLEEAARLCATPSSVLLGITIPQVLPAFVMAVLLLFCLVLGETGAPTFLRVNVYAVESLAQFAAFYDFSSATAAACPLLLVVLLAFWGLHLLGVRPSAVLQAPSTGRAPEPFQLGRSGSRLAVLAGALWAGLAGLPLAALFLRSAAPRAYVAALAAAGASFGRSFSFAVLGASLIVLFGLLIAYGRMIGALRQGTEMLTLFLFAVPGPVLGIGLISLWNRPATNGIYGTPVILLLGYLAQYVVVGVWITKAALASIPRSMEEAAAVAGAGWARRLATIAMPLAWKGLAGAWLLAFLFCFRDTGIAMVVYPPGRDTLTVRLFTMMANGRPEVIAALCMLILASVAAPLAVLGILDARSRQ